MAIDTNVYFGTPGSLLTIPWPRGGIAGPRSRNVSQFLLGSGGQQIWKTLSGKRTYQLGYQSLDYATFAQLLAFDQGHNGPGPFAILDPGQRNMLTANQSAATSLTNDTTDFTIGPLAFDNFNRTAASGWGTADTGQAWTTSGGSAGDYSVLDGAGRHSVGSVNVDRKTILAVSYADQDVTVGPMTLGGGVSASGQSIDLGLLLRYQNTTNYYQMFVSLNTNNTITAKISKVVGGSYSNISSGTVSGVTVSSSLQLSIRAQVEGTTLRLKAWDSTQSEPDAWTTTTTDSAFSAAGAVGVLSSLETGNTNTRPVVVDWDAITVNELAPTLASDSGLFRRGPRALNWAFGLANSNSPLLLDSPSSEWPGIPCAVRPHTFSAWAQTYGGSVTLQAIMKYLDADGTQIGSTTGSPTSVTSGSWTQVTVTGTPTAGSAYLNCSLAPSGATVGAGEQVNLDQLMLNEGSSADSSWSPGTGVVPVQVVALPDTQPWFYPDYRAGPGLTLQEIGP